MAAPPPKTAAWRSVSPTSTEMYGLPQLLVCVCVCVCVCVFSLLLLDGFLLVVTLVMTLREAPTSLTFEQHLNFINHNTKNATIF